MLCIIHGCSNNVLEPFLTILGSVSYHTAWGKQRRLSFLVFPVKTSKNNWFKIPHLLFLEPPTAWSIFLSINKSLPKTAEIQSPNLESRGRSLSFSSVFVTTRTNQWFDWPLQRHTHTHTHSVFRCFCVHTAEAQGHTPSAPHQSSTLSSACNTVHLLLRNELVIDDVISSAAGDDECHY